MVLRLPIKLLLSWHQILPFHNSHLLPPLHLLAHPIFQVIHIGFHPIFLILYLLLKLLIGMHINLILGSLILEQQIIWFIPSTSHSDSIPHSDPIPSTSSLPITPLPVLRRSTRPHNPPPYLFEYSCKSISTKPNSGLPYDILDCLDYSHLGPTFHSFVMVVNTTPSKLVSFH